MQDQGCVVHAAMPVRKIEKTLTSSVVCPFVQRRSNAGWIGEGGSFGPQEMACSV